MNRAIFTMAGVFGASSLLLVDSAVKGAALLLLAAIAALILRRDSAATRNLVWLLAIVAMLVVPVLSALLPQWRILPEWARLSSEPVVVATGRPPINASPADDVELPRNAQPMEVERPSIAPRPAAELPDLRPALAIPAAIPVLAVWSWNWIDVLPIMWALGFSVLTLRLMTARWMLWNSERRGTVIWSSRQPAMATHDPIVTALEAACLQLGISRPLSLLIHPDKTIPVVWGILRCRLLLPAAARHWTGEQLRSVLLHELAHIKRHDTLVQLLTQIACALHWFNPLVWFAAWRLGVERERACDDLVLTSGVRPSAYAGHLLEVVTDLSPARWTQSCGLAMARKSSLEGRLVAVLSDKLNRRGVSAALAAIALALAAGIAVPIAMLRAAEEQAAAPLQQKLPTPKGGAKLEPGVEERLKWGEPVNGLRAAIVIRTVSDKPKAGDLPDLYLAVQNVSKAPIHLSDASVPPTIDLRVLYLRVNGEIKWGLGARVPALGDFLLQPREAAFLPMFSLEKIAGNSDKSLKGHTIGSFMAESAIKDAGENLFAELHIEKAPAGAWTGKLKTGETTGATAAGQPQPKGKDAQALFKKWQDSARSNGKIPGGMLGPLWRAAANFIKLNPSDERAPKLAELFKRIDTSRDWTPKDAITLLDDVTAIYADLPNWVADAPRFSLGGDIRNGQPLPAALQDAPWGKAQPNGLRTAWLLEPRAAEHRLGTSLRSRILFHNAGKDSVVFRALTWNQASDPKARDAKDAEINIVSTYWTTLPQVVACRLAPGDFVEMIAAGIGVGANKDDEDWQGTRVGSWIEAKKGDEVTFTPGPVSLNGMNNDDRSNGEPGWWLDFITDRLSLDAPLPADAAERARILDRAMRHLFGAAPTAEEAAAFSADRALTALDSLAKRLAKRAGTTSFTGSLTSGPTKFRVLPVDPDAAKKPRTASNPGRFSLADKFRLDVSLRQEVEGIVNEAIIVLYSPDATKPAPGKPQKIKLPDGYGTWAAAWTRGATVLWVLQKGHVRSYDFTNPA